MPGKLSQNHTSLHCARIIVPHIICAIDQKPTFFWPTQSTLPSSAFIRPGASACQIERAPIFFSMEETMCPE